MAPPFCLKGNNCIAGAYLYYHKTNSSGNPSRGCLPIIASNKNLSENSFNTSNNEDTYTLFNDAVLRVIVVPGFKLQLYQNSDYSGRNAYVDNTSENTVYYSHIYEIKNSSGDSLSRRMVSSVKLFYKDNGTLTEITNDNS